MYECIMKLKTGKIITEKFEKEVDYFDYLYAARNDINWAKLLNEFTGEVYDEYTELSLLSPTLVDIHINQNLMPKSTRAILLSRQKIYWFLKVIKKHSPIVSEYLLENNLTFVSVPEKNTKEDSIYLPKELMVVSVSELKKILKMLEIESKDDNYKKRIYRTLIDLDGYEIKFKNMLEGKGSN